MVVCNAREIETPWRGCSELSGSFAAAGHDWHLKELARNFAQAVRNCPLTQFYLTGTYFPSRLDCTFADPVHMPEHCRPVFWERKTVNFKPTLSNSITLPHNLIILPRPDSWNLVHRLHKRKENTLPLQIGRTVPQKIQSQVVRLMAVSRWEVL